VLNPTCRSGDARSREAAMRDRAADTIILDTLDQLHAHRHGIGGYCRAC
jgi:hypothetical protein